MRGLNRNFTKLREYFFVLKENNEHCLRSACTRCLLNINNADYVQRKHAHAEHKQRWLRWLCSRVPYKMAEDCNSGRGIAE